jgi:hypothetical protein
MPRGATQSDEGLRRTINAATNIAEAWNGFVQWVAFGGEGVIRQNNREEQRKTIRYNHLVANLVVFHNVVSMTRVLQELVDEGYPVTPEILAHLSPYKTGHINRFGHYEVRFDQIPPPMIEDLRLARASLCGHEWLTLRVHFSFSSPEARRLNPHHHVRKIVALSDIYAPEAVARAMEDAFVYEAFSSEYIANLVEQRARCTPEASALHLTRRGDLLDVSLAPPDLSIYHAHPQRGVHNPEEGPHHG